jgi:hypothetical protein
MKTILFATAAVLLATSPALAQVDAAGAGVATNPTAGAAAATPLSPDHVHGAGASPTSPDNATITDGRSMARGAEAPSATFTAVNVAAQITVGQTLRTESGQALGQIVDVQNSPGGEATRVIVEAPDKSRRNVPPADLKVVHGGVVTSHSAADIQALPEAAP